MIFDSIQSSFNTNLNCIFELIRDVKLVRVKEQDNPVQRMSGKNGLTHICQIVNTFRIFGTLLYSPLLFVYSLVLSLTYLLSLQTSGEPQ